jgi:ubiquinone/menaquinone biosynthesis C-methylase UbiE
MLGRIFIALCRVPGLKKVLWRAWYDYLAASQGAPEWTFMNYGYLDDRMDREELPAALYRHVVGPVDLKGSTVLEVGSGRGGGASVIKRTMGPARMIGVDLSKNAVDFCRAMHRVEGLEFKVGDAEHLPFEDSSFDAVVNVESSHCYPSFDKFIGEVRRVLRPGGHFLYADFREDVDALRNSGLTVVRETDITPNVIAALEQDNDQKLAVIHRLVPRFLQPSFFDFAAVRGSSIFEAFRTRKLIYRSFVLRK